MGAEARPNSGGHEGPPAAVEALVLALHMVVAEAAHAHVHCIPACGPILHAHARLSVSACLANDFAPQSRQASEMMHAQALSRRRPMSLCQDGYVCNEHVEWRLAFFLAPQRAKSAEVPSL